MVWFHKTCSRKDSYSIDLKQQYDTCEEEVCYKGFRADLMLSSKEHPEREPLFLEISVSHDCEPEKLASGIKIIELKIMDEKDVLRPLVEENNLSPKTESTHPRKKKDLPPVRFYNFERKLPVQPFYLKRFLVAKDKDGILRGFDTKNKDNDLNCQNFDESHKVFSIYELVIPANAFMEGRGQDFYTFGMLKAVNKGIKVRHCQLCRLYRYCVVDYKQNIIDKQTGEKRSILQKIPMSRINGKTFDKIAYATRCGRYTPDLSVVKSRLQSYPYIYCWEWERKTETNK